MLFALLLGALLPSFALAQTFTGGAVDPLSLDITPQYPRPYDTILIRPSSNLINLSASTVTVYANGTKIYSGSGTAPATFTLPGAGSATQISMTVAWAGNSYQKSAIVRPAEVDLIPEAQSTLPPFYAGSALPAPGGAMRLVAVSDLRSLAGRQYAPDELSYEWKQDTRVLEDQSGVGRNVLGIAAPNLYRYDTYSVTVSTADNALVAQSSVTLTPELPKALVYEQDPLLGTRYERALSGTFNLPNTEDTFVAVPYFFTKTPAFAWTVNGNASQTTPSITVRATGNGRGTATLFVTAKGASVFERADAGFVVGFNASPAGGLFGL